MKFTASGGDPLLSVEKAKAEAMDLAVRLYKDGKIGLSKAAELSGSSIAEFEDQLVKRGVGIVLYAKDDLSIFKSEIKNVREIAKSFKT